MEHFFRAVQQSFRYKWSIAASLVNALVIGLLWGASITSVYPFIEVVLQGQTIDTWFDGQIERSKTSIATRAAEIEQIEKKLAAPGEAESGLRSRLSLAEGRQAAEEKSLSFLQWARPWLSGRVPKTPFATLLVVMEFLIAATLLKGICLVVNSLLVARVADRTVIDMRQRFFRAALEMDQRTLDRHGSAGLMSQIVHNTNLIGEGLRTLYGTSVREPLKMAACLVGAALVSWQLLLFSLVVAPLGGLLVHYLSQRTKRAAMGECMGMATIAETILETLNGIKIVKIYNAERTQRHRFKDNSWALYRMGRKINFYDALVKPVTELTGIVTIVLAILVGAHLVLNQQTHLLGIRFSDRPLSAGGLFIFYAMLAGAADPARKMGDIYTVMVRASAACRGLYEVFEAKPEVAAPEHPARLPIHSDSIRFENVRFAYDPDRWVLDLVSFEIPFGQTVALVGQNGCGKSTILNLLARFYDPQQGSVLMDGVDLRNVCPKSLRRQMAMVTQDPILFRGSIWENIAFSSPSATSERILSAARAAHVDDFVAHLSHGYETQVGDRGNALSGGQRQRVALARAILADPRILVLDEATSQIDQQSEDLVQDSLHGFLKGRTTILVTHRPSTIRLAQRVLIMDRGKIIDDVSSAVYLRQVAANEPLPRAA